VLSGSAPRALRGLAFALAAAASVAGLSGCATRSPESVFRSRQQEDPARAALVPDVSPFAGGRPGPELAPVLAILRHWRREAAPAEADAWFRARERHGGPLELAPDFLAQHGLWADAGRGSPDRLKERLRGGVPVMVALQRVVFDVSGRRHVLVFGYSDADSQFLCHAGGARPVRIAYGEFDAGWRGCDYWMLWACPPDHPRWNLLPGERVSRGRFYENARQYGRALEDYRSAWQAGLRQGTLFLYMGNTLRALDRPGEAETAYRDAIAANPLEGRAYNNLAYLLAERSNSVNEAVGLARQALALEPTSPLAMDTLGFALYQQGDLREAGDVLERARARARWHPVRTQIEIAMHLVWVHHRSGNDHLAREVLADVLGMDPGFAVPPELRPIAANAAGTAP